MVGRLLPFALLVCAGCVASSLFQTTAPMALHRDEQDMKAEVLRHVVLGTPVEDVKKTMRAHGFSCKIDEDPAALWTEADPALRGEPFLVCRRGSPRSSWSARDDVIIWFRLAEGRVIDIHRVEWDHTCL